MKVRKTKTARDESEEKVFPPVTVSCTAVKHPRAARFGGIYRREIAGPPELESFVGAPAEPQNRPYVGTN